MKTKFLRKIRKSHRKGFYATRDYLIEKDKNDDWDSYFNVECYRHTWHMWMRNEFKKRGYYDNNI